MITNDFTEFLLVYKTFESSTAEDAIIDRPGSSNSPTPSGRTVSAIMRAYSLRDSGRSFV